MLWAGYSRVSRVGDREDRLISPELQADRIRAYAAQIGIEVEILPPELDVSGGTVERPILGEIIRGIEQGRFAGIVVAQLDRLSRMDMADAAVVVRRIEQEAGGRVLSAAEQFDPSTPEGRMARNVMFAMADMQLGRYKLQFIAAKRRAVENGIWPTPTPPPGYRVEARKHGGSGHLEIDERRARQIRRAFEMRAAGTSWGDLAAFLKVGVSNTGKIIRNRAYLGEVRLTVAGEEVVNATAHEPIIDVALFEAAQLNHPRPARRRHDPALLGGLIRCAGCGDVMTLNANANGPLYRCQPRKARRQCPSPTIVGQVGIERLVEQSVINVIASMHIDASEREGAVQVAAQDLEQADRELRAFQESVDVSGVGVEHFAAGMRQRVQIVEQARRRLAEARMQSEPLPHPDDVAALWPHLTVTERRHVLRGALRAVVVSKGRGDLESRVRLIPAGFDMPDDVGAAGA